MATLLEERQGTGDRGQGTASVPLPNPALGACPLPIDDYPTVVMAHGGGGRMSKMLRL